MEAHTNARQGREVSVSGDGVANKETASARPVAQGAEPAAPRKDVPPASVAPRPTYPPMPPYPQVLEGKARPAMLVGDVPAESATSRAATRPAPAGSTATPDDPDAHLRRIEACGAAVLVGACLLFALLRLRGGLS